MMQCQTMNRGGGRCAEKRPGWMWLWEDGGRLRYVCTRHLPPHPINKVSVNSMTDFLASGASTT